jgi:NADH:ubiquinone oxidoreductase subunit F (NADH-binding)/(2Fe-2S) ferredoxin
MSDLTAYGHSINHPVVSKVTDCLNHLLFGEENDGLRKRINDTLSPFLRLDVTKPVVSIGTATCGIGAGSLKTMDATTKYASDHNLDMDVVEVGCIGLCAMEPILDIQLPGRPRIFFKKVAPEDVEPLLDAIFAGNVLMDSVLGQCDSDTLERWKNVPRLNEIPFFARQTRLVLANCGIIDPLNLEEYMAHNGYQTLACALHTTTPGEVCDIVETSGLRGRGGGGFPTGKKWKFARNTTANRKYLICNADEGDPGAFMDRAVIESDPHRLLEGIALAAYAIGASQAYIYIRAEYPLAISRLKTAILKAREAGLLGHNILDSGFNLEIIIKQGAGAFVCGEETALIASIEGRRGMPRPRPPFPATSGLFGKPTIINNVETLTNIRGIIEDKARKFGTLGTTSSKGTKVFALSGKVNLTGLVEVAMGTSLREIVFDIGGGIPEDKKFKAVQIGGPSGGCIPEQHLDIEVDYESLKEVGAMMGSGGLVVMDESTCMVDVAKFFMNFIQKESCGKCIPCREGTRRMLEILERITKGHRMETGTDALIRFQGVMYLTRLAEVIQSTSLCGLGQSAPNPVLSTLRWFKDEYEAHIYERHCPAGVCKELLKYRIDVDMCKGCTLCAKKCPADAIIGTPKSPHYIVEERCIGCGTCLDVCKFGAVIAE